MNFVKVDFTAAAEADHAAIKKLTADSEIKLIGKKLETWKDYERAKLMGYAYFQGHFFLEPQLLKRREISGSAAHCMQLLQLVHQKPMDQGKIEEVLKQEPTLLYKLLRFLNSPVMARPVEVKSVHSAISLLGDDEFRRWASLVAVVVPATDKPGELIRTGLTRAFFCEALARAKTRRSAAFEYFTVGLFSIMSAILDRPLADITAELAVSEKVRDALEGKRNEMRYALDAAVAFELGKWEEFAAAMEGLELAEERAPQLLKDAELIVTGLQV